MILHTVLRRGSDHQNFCQDFYSIRETEKYLFCCIFDGCSGGVDSHFASALMGKIFNNTIKNWAAALDLEDKSIKDSAKFLVYLMSKSLKDEQKKLGLDIVELLSTVVLCTIKKENRECIITAFGDGYFCVDNKEVMIKNTRFIHKENGDNMPDYLVYDLDEIETYGEFDKWFETKSEIHLFENVKNISIASDGIGTFKKFKENSEVVNPIDFLVKDEGLIDTKNMLERKYNILQNKYNMINTDDLSLIRIKF